MPEQQTVLPRPPHPLSRAARSTKRMSTLKEELRQGQMELTATEQQVGGCLVIFAANPSVVASGQLHVASCIHAQTLLVLHSSCTAQAWAMGLIGTGDMQGLMLMRATRKLGSGINTQPNHAYLSSTRIIQNSCLSGHSRVVKVLASESKILLGSRLLHMQRAGCSPHTCDCCCVCPRRCPGANAA